MLCYYQSFLSCSFKVFSRFFSPYICTTCVSLSNFSLFSSSFEDFNAYSDLRHLWFSFSDSELNFSSISRI